MAAISRWGWRLAWSFLLLVGLAFLLLHASMPSDGVTGDLESFTPAGFRVQWVLEDRPGGLRAGDVIVRAGGYTYAEWLDGAPRGAEWRNGGTVTYEVLRDGRLLDLPILLTPISFEALVGHWGAQFLASLALVIVGSYVFWRRQNEPAARLLMLFCLMLAAQLWGDTYNFMYTLLPGRLLFWVHFLGEYISFILCYSAVLHFALIFPQRNPLIVRYPVPMLFVTYALHPLIVAGVMVLSTTWSQALVTGSHVSFAVAFLQAGLAIAAGFYSVHSARDPVTRAQIRWMVWAPSVAAAIALPGYVVPMALTGRPFIPHPLIMLLTVFVPVIFAIAVMRYRLFDVEVVINRTLVYGTLTILLGGLYLVLVRLLTLLVQGVLLWEDETLVVFVATLSIALAFFPLRRRVQDLIDRAFYRDKVDVRQVLLSFGHEIRTIIDLPDLLRALVDRVTAMLHSSHSAVVLLAPDGSPQEIASCGWPSSLEICPLGRDLQARLRAAEPVSRPRDPVCPLLVPLLAPRAGERDLVGVLALGPQLSGREYSHEDQELLMGLAEQAGTAIRVAQLIEENQAEIVRKEAAEAASHSKSVFLANMSHELRTPLTAIIGYSELLQDEAADEGYTQIIPVLDRIRLAGTHLLSIISDILDLSKIEAGRMELYPETFELQGIIDEVVVVSQLLIRKNGNRLSLDMPDYLGTMYADLGKVRQILLNLLSNAAKFTTAGRVTLTIARRSAITAAEQAVCDEWLRFSVSDTGIGMTPEQIAHIFEAFTQADASTTRSYGGTGLGLTISQYFCHMMQGRIEVQSQAGQGSTFTVHLPAIVPRPEISGQFDQMSLS
jgi:signal transduction histidine kinase